MTPLEAGDNQAQQGQDAVQLMTVHAAKGLNSDAVFITGSKRGCSRTRTASWVQVRLEEGAARVAITRARRRLYISLAQSRMLRYAMLALQRRASGGCRQGRPVQAGRRQRWRTHSATNTIAPAAALQTLMCGEQNSIVNGQGVHHAV